jgi:hypothetical protein
VEDIRIGVFSVMVKLPVIIFIQTGFGTILMGEVSADPARKLFIDARKRKSSVRISDFFICREFFF